MARRWRSTSGSKSAAPITALDPNVDGAAPETIIESFDDIAVTIAANGVILDGLQITGHGFDGVIANDYANSVVVTDVEIRNNIVEGTHPDVWDIYFYNSPDTPTHAVVSNNHISGGHIGVIGYNNGYIDVLDNVIDNVDVGVQTGNMWQPAPGGDTPVIAGNQISANHVGIFHNLQYSTATGYSIHDNSVWGADGAWDDASALSCGRSTARPSRPFRTTMSAALPRAMSSGTIRRA